MAIIHNKAYLIFPNSKFKQRWDLIIIVLAIFNCFTIPIQVSFDPKSMQGVKFTVANLMIDFFFLLDIFISFRIVYIDDLGNEVSDPKKIACHYVSYQFWVDLAATLPMDQIILVFFDQDNSAF